MYGRGCLSFQFSLQNNKLCDIGASVPCQWPQNKAIFGCLVDQLYHYLTNSHPGKKTEGNVANVWNERYANFTNQTIQQYYKSINNNNINNINNNNHNNKNKNNNLSRNDSQHIQGDSHRQVPLPSQHRCRYWDMLNCCTGRHLEKYVVDYHSIKCLLNMSIVPRSTEHN